MYVSKIGIVDMRCFQRAEIELSKSITLLVGENNSGKTTILECLLALQVPTLGINDLRYGEKAGQCDIELAELDPGLILGNSRDSAQAHRGGRATVTWIWTRQPPSQSAPVFKAPFSGPFAHFASEYPNNLIVA